MNTAQIEGYASLFGVKDMAGDTVAPGAFTRSLRARGPSAVKLLYQHDANEPVGVLEDVYEDGAGLFVAGALNLATQRGAESFALLRQGALSGLSIGFNIVASERLARGERLLTEIDLWEVSLVTFPMLPGACLWPAGEGEAPALLRTLNHASRLFLSQGV